MENCQNYLIISYLSKAINCLFFQILLNEISSLSKTTTQRFSSIDQTVSLTVNFFCQRLSLKLIFDTENFIEVVCDKILMGNG